MPTTLFCQHSELISIQQYFQTLDRDTDQQCLPNSMLTHTWKAKTSTVLHVVITQVRQFISFGSQVSYHTSHRKVSLCASPQENFKSAFMRNKLNSLLPPKKINLFITLYHWPHHKFTVLFFQGSVTEQPFSTLICLLSQLFLFQSLCLYMQKHIYFFCNKTKSALSINVVQVIKTSMACMFQILC